MESGLMDVESGCGEWMWKVARFQISHMCAKHYENPTMLSQVTAKNSRDVFLRHSVY